MQFLLSDEQKAMRQSARDFAKAEIAPLAFEMDKAKKLDNKLLGKMADLGYFGLSISPDYDGSFVNHLTTTAILMEIAQGCAALATMVGASSGLFGGNVEKNGTPTQKEKYLPKIASGEWVGCMGLTEPQAGSDAFSIRTKAEKKDGYYILNGSKTFISNAPIADVALIYATVDAASGTDGLSAFIVERDFEGFSTGKPFDKVGLRASPTGEIFLDDCKVPEENLLGGIERKGWKQMINGLNVERFAWSALAVGLAKSALQAAFDYSNERKQFGSPLSFFEMIQDKIATMATDVNLGEMHCLVTAKAYDKGESISLPASYCKLFCGDMVMRVVTEAAQIFGGYGFMEEYPVAKYFRDAKVFAIGAGTSEIQKLIIARQLAMKGIQ